MLHGDITFLLVDIFDRIITFTQGAEVCHHTKLSNKKKGIHEK